MKELPSWVKQGAKFRWIEQLWHVRAIVDDKVVCRTWHKFRGRWHYECHPDVIFTNPTFAKPVKKGCR